MKCSGLQDASFYHHPSQNPQKTANHAVPYGKSQSHPQLAFQRPLPWAQIRLLSSRPISDGLRVILKPHSSITASLASAVSAPPEISAPA